MHESSTFPNLLSADQRRAAAAIIDQSQVALLSCFYWRSDQPIGPRRLADNLVHVQVKGRLRFRVGAVERKVAPGDVVLVPEGVEHEAHLVGGDDHSEAYSLHVQAYTAQGRPLFEFFASPFGRLPGPAGWLTQLAVLTHLLGHEPELGRRYGEPLLRSLLVQQIAERNPLRETPPACDPRIWLAIGTILRQFAQPLTVAALARQAGLGTVQFRRLFARHTGHAPKAYIQQLRLSKARALLQADPTLTIKQVAETTGFGDPHYLHEVFRQKLRTTPASMRAAQPPAVTAPLPSRSRRRASGS